MEDEIDIKIEDTGAAWATSNGRFWVPTPIANRLPCGVYSVAVSQRLGPYLDQVRVVKDDLVVLPGMGADVVLDEIEQFVQRKDRYKARGVVHKRGIIMEGPPGSGKTSNTELMIELFVNKFDGVVFLAQDPSAVALGIGLIRKREPERLIMVVIEDIDAVVRGGGEEHLLNLLDGKHQADGVVVVATTNHLNKLPDRIANRPSRFDLVVQIGLPAAEARDAFLKAKEPQMSDAQRKAVVDITDGYSIAHLKELMLLTEVYEMPLEAAHARIKAIMERKLMPEQATLKAVKVPAAFSIQDAA
ncbi:MAG: ATP-binding protein [Aquamicrobium sp.]|uniref:AAA family ATPase n=1 Tax=Aquamicrobium sp. TaxID=1872579 RepID=UPI00349F039E|nr:ATP-binding protein [Aquamicrobium sp.]